jgi:hypothetical protein
MLSPLASDPTHACGNAIVARFVTDGRIDTSCLSDLLPALYSAPSPEFAKTWWGTEDDWGDGVSPAPHDSRARLAMHFVDAVEESVRATPWTTRIAVLRALEAHRRAEASLIQ